MLVRGQTTEQRIADIASKFQEGLGQYQAGQNRYNKALQEENRYQDALARQEEAQKRQQAIQELEIESKLTETTGKNLIGSGVGKLYLSGGMQGIGDLLNSAPTSRKAELAAEDRKLDQDYKRSMINKNNAAAMGPTGTGKPTTAEQSVDRSFAKTYDDFIVGGGYTKVDRGLNALKNVSSQLGKKDADLTGPLTGRVPEFIQSFTNPKAIEARDEVGTIIQDNLRAILGPAYTEKEGERVIKRAYDPTLSEKANKAKLDALIAQMEGAARAKLEAAKYYEQYGTMRGYKGTVINSVDDIFRNQDTVNTRQASPVAPEAVRAIKSMSDEDLLKFVQGG